MENRWFSARFETARNSPNGWIISASNNAWKSAETSKIFYPWSTLRTYRQLGIARTELKKLVLLFEALASLLSQFSLFALFHFNRLAQQTEKLWFDPFHGSFIWEMDSKHKNRYSCFRHKNWDQYTPNIYLKFFFLNIIRLRIHWVLSILFPDCWIKWRRDWWVTQ